MNHREQIKSLISQAESLPFGDTKVSLLEQAVKIADVHQDEEMGYETRDELITAATFSGKAHLTLVHFPWMMAKSKQQPEKFPASQLHWKYKWLMSSLPEFPSIPKQTILATLEDMREEFRKAQYKERTTWEYVRIVYMELGDKEKAAEAQAHFLEAEPTTVMDRWFYNANCQACETNNQVSYYIDIGEFDKAAELAEILFSGKETCANVPKVTYANLLLPLLRTGELEKAVELCKKGLAQVKNQRNFISSQTKILAFLALTDNLKLASQWFVAHAGFAEESYVPIEKLEYLRAAHLFWKAFADPKTRGWMPTLPLAHPLYQKTAQDYDPQILAEDARKRAMELSQAFDQRNGNTFFSEETERYWEIENYATPLKLPNRKI